MQRTLVAAGFLALCLSPAANARTEAPPPPRPRIKAPPPPSTPPPPGVNPFAWYYPALAQRMEIDGKAVMSCDVDVEGRLQACELVSETPEGYGFGAATLEVSRYFKLKPKLDANGVPVPGGRINFPLSWSIPKDEGPAKDKTKAAE